MFARFCSRGWAVLLFSGVGCVTCPGSGPLAPTALDTAALDALADRRVNEVRLAKAHNCYQKEGSEGGWKQVTEALAHTNVIEIDIRPSTAREDFSVGHMLLRRNNCPRHERMNGWLSDCLAGIREWSELHPDHPFVVINIDMKVGLGGKYALFDQILEKVGTEKLYRPQDLRGTHADLRSALESDGWPKLADLRGRFMFVVTGGTPKNPATPNIHRNLSLRSYVLRRYDTTPFEANAFACPDVTDGNDLELHGRWEDLDDVKNNIVCGNVNRRYVHRLHTDSKRVRQTLVLAWGYGRGPRDVAHAATHWLSVVGVDLSSVAPDAHDFIGVRGRTGPP